MNTLLTALLLALVGAFPDADALVTEDREEFTLTSATSGELSVSRTVVIQSKDGMDAGQLVLVCDSFRKLVSFSGSVQAGTSKPVKLRKGDLFSMAYSSGLVDDDLTYSYIPEAVNFPVTVHYEYKMGFHGGFASFPGFFPVLDEKVAVEEAEYTVNVPEGYGVKSYATPAFSYECTSEKGRDKHRWSLEGFAPIALEHMMPPTLELIPYVYVSPETINLSGFEGSQKDWKELGQWVYRLQEGRQTLSDEEVERVRTLTAGCKTPLEKLEVLYAYLKERTRYVSIQLGIGGLRAFPASEVSRTGFGDCKGLSNYMKALLAAVGVESDYYVIHTDRSRLLRDYASVGQMNHAMLAVPMPQLKDTVWVECTNPSIPLGYRHSNAAGHDVLFAKEDGGEFIRIPSYPDSLSRMRQLTDVTLFDDASARVSVRRELYLDYVDSYIGFRDLQPLKQTQELTSGLNIMPVDVSVKSVTDNFDQYPSLGRNFVPEMDIEYAYGTNVYGNVSGSRIFLPVNPTSRSLKIQKGKRVNELCLEEPWSREEVITLHLPEGYRAEGLPKDLCLESGFASFKSASTLSEDGKTLTICQALTFHPFRIPASDYPTYRDFARAVNRAYAATLVLTKEQWE